MKIALVSPYDFAYPGGVVNHITALKHHFTKMGHEVKVIAPASKAVPDLGDGFIPMGRPRSVPTSGSIVRITISLILAPKIKAVLAEENFDIIHLHEPLMPMLCTAILRFSHTATIGTFHACHGRPSYNFAGPISTTALRRRARKLHGKIAVSKTAMQFAQKYIPGPYDIIPNGIDLERFSPDVSPIDEFCDGKMNILFVGRLEGRKGFNYLIKAYKRVKQEFPNSRLIAVGPGIRLRRRYERQIKRSGLKDVILVGHVSDNELPRYYKTADIFCSPATGRESFGIVLLEAMATGKPIVATNIDGYASLMTHGVEGLLVPPKDDERLAQALLSLMNDESLRQEMGARGRLTAAEYSWEHVAQRVLNFYKRILSEPPCKERLPEFEAMSTSV